MPKNKEIEITLTLKDEASKKIQSFRSSVKEFSKDTKDSLAPILQLRRAWMYTGIAIAATIGTFTKTIQEIAKLREEISKLDIISIKLGISSEQLSKKLYGFNIGTFYARTGSDQAAMFLNYIQQEILRLKTAMAEGIGGTKLAVRTQLIYEQAARKYQEEHKFTFPIVGGSIQNPFAPFGEEAKTMRQEAEIKARKQLEEESKAFHELEAIKKGLVGETQDKTQQLVFSTYEYKKGLLAKEIENLRVTGVDEITLRAYSLTAFKRLEEDKTLELYKQQAARLKAEGRTMDALKIEQRNALTEFKRQFGGDGEMVREFIRGQQAIYRQAQLNFLGLKGEFQIFHDGFVSLVGSMTTTFSDVFYNTITGQIKNLKEAFNSFGQAILKNLSDMLAQYIVMKAIMGIGSIAGSFAGGTNILTSGSYNIGGQNLAATAHIGGIGGTYVGMAEGGAGIVKRPTLFLAGESGPERYRFAPLSRNRGENADGEVHVHYHSTVIIKAWDFSDIYNNKDEIKAIVNESLRLQGSVQKSIRSYGG